MKVKEARKATGNKPTEKMFTEEQANFMVKKFASQVVMANTKTALLLAEYLNKIEDEDESIDCLEFIFDYVVCSDEERFKIFKENQEDPQALEMIHVAFGIRMLLGLENLNDLFE